MPTSPFGAQWRQHDRLMRLVTPLGEDALLAERAAVRESLGPVRAHCGFHIVLTVLSADAHIALNTLLGQPARLELLTTDGPAAPRPFHGQITRVTRLGANGGFARYELHIEPWLAFLAHRQDSHLFEQRSVIDIIDTVFGRWVGQGKLTPAWRWALAEPERYPKRGITTQYQESDLAFVRRLLAEEGLFCWFEHQGDDSATLGRHTLVIADHNGAFTDNPQATFRFTQSGPSLREDSLHRWHGQRQLDTTVLAAASWDYRSLSTREQRAESTIDNGRAPSLVATDDPGQYAWQNHDHGQRMLRAQREAIDARLKQFLGEGSVRSAAPGSTFTLADHAEHDRDPPEHRHFLITDITHHIRNNLTEHIPGSASGIKPSAPVGPDSSGQRPTEPEPLYRNRLRAIRSHIPWRPLMRDGHGRQIHPRPTVAGTLSAIVVGPGTPTHTDRDARIRVQFAWQRGSASANRLATDTDNAPANDSLGAWVRLISPVAGANWGTHWIPRPGQEVLVAFAHGNIDRPVIIGALYNGQGNPDAPGNRTAATTMAACANAPAWFAGHSAPEHRHNASLSGIKTQQLSTSRLGHGGHNHLIFDDTPGEARISLGTTEYASALHLGHLKQQHDNARLKDRGHGAELTTTAAMAIRAGSGLLISADARPGASGAHLDSREAIAQTEAAHRLTVALAQAAAKQGATLPGEPAPEALSASDGLERAIDTLGATATTGSVASSAAAGPDASGQASFKPIGGGEGTVPAWSAPRLQYSAPGGIAQLTPASAILAAGKSLSLAGQDINLVAQTNHRLAAKSGIALFTIGKAGQDGRPNTETGIALHAASGTVSVQAQSGQIRAAADKTLTVASTEADVAAHAAKHILATAQGAYLKLDGTNIELHAPGPVKLKASLKKLTGPAMATAEGTRFPKGEGPDMGEHVRQVFDERFCIRDRRTGEPLKFFGYRLESDTGEIIGRGMTDAEGRIERIHTSRPTTVSIIPDED